MSWPPADPPEKGEWPLSQNAAFEAESDPSQPFDYNAVPERFYFDVESVGSIPVRSVVEQGLDLLVENLAGLILAVQDETGRDEDDEEEMNGSGPGGVDGIIEPDLGGGGMMMPPGGGGYDAYGGGGGGAGYGATPAWAGSGMSPLRR
jgi:DNA-directed RNA polymerase II subunit RPB3